MDKIRIDDCICHDRIEEHLEIKDKILLEIDKTNDSNLNFYILIKIDAIESNSSKIKVQFVGNFSSMIEMMIKKPLNAFIDSLKNKIENISI